MVVSLDFDGTLVRTDYFPVFDPTPLPGCLEALNWMKENLSAKFILLTQRDHDHFYDSQIGKVRLKMGANKNRVSVLQEAIDWCKDVGIDLWGINENPQQFVWSRSRKVYSDLIIDDRSLLPLDSNNCVDWPKTLELIKSRFK